MQIFKPLFALGVGCLAVLGTPIASLLDHHKRSTVDPSAVSLDVRAVPNVVKVELWDGLGTGTKTNPTYKAKLSTGIVGNPTHADVAEYARKGWEHMMTQSPRQKDTHLMAALYIPTRRSLFLSSVPDGPAIGHINDDGATAAPAWWSQVQNRQPPRVLHAEDSAASLYEDSLTTKLAAGAQYPTGSFIAVYGIVNGKAKDAVPLCSGGGDRPLDPPCQTVFTNLGVGF
ncbi:hypothetical protein PG994_004306 [Apiospora phragmitis]|uniref:Uncharacterized protein n=1 Tax=Apiospora phragmitis TaxID=2905665 RepID=A0ABR1VQG4_9PEZI